VAIPFPPSAPPDLRIFERARHRLRQVADTAALPLPNRHAGPLLEIHGSGLVLVEHVGFSKRLADVVQHHEWMLAHAGVRRLVCVLVEAHQPLLNKLVVGVLHEHREQLQRVAMRERRAAVGLVDVAELDPVPPRFAACLHRVPRQLALDCGWIKEPFARIFFLIADRIG